MKKGFGRSQLISVCNNVYYSNSHNECITFLSSQNNNDDSLNNTDFNLKICSWNVEGLAKYENDFLFQS